MKTRSKFRSLVQQVAVTLLGVVSLEQLVTAEAVRTLRGDSFAIVVPASWTERPDLAAEGKAYFTAANIRAEVNTLAVADSAGEVQIVMYHLRRPPDSDNLKDVRSRLSDYFLGIRSGAESSGGKLLRFEPAETAWVMTALAESEANGHRARSITIGFVDRRGDDHLIQAMCRAQTAQLLERCNEPLKSFSHVWDPADLVPLEHKGHGRRDAQRTGMLVAFAVVALGFLLRSSKKR